MTPEELQARVREVFLVEAGELVHELESALLELETNPKDVGLVNRVFRALHTLKGSGATSGFPDLSQFLHQVEDVFFAAREGRVAVEAALVDRALAIKDVVARYLAAPPAQAGAVIRDSGACLQALLQFLPAKVERSPAAGPAQPAPSAGRYHLRFVPKPEFFQTGADPGMFLDDLRALGSCEITALVDSIPPLEALDPETCFLGWEIDLATQAPPDALREVFAFVEDACSIEIGPHASGAPETAAGGAGTATWQVNFTTDASVLDSPGVMETLWRDLGRLGRLTILGQPAGGVVGSWKAEVEAKDDVDADRLREAFAFLPCATPAIERTERTPMIRPAAPQGEQAASGPAAKAAVEMLRVPAAKLDRLVDMVGELVILRSLVGNACATMGSVPAGLASASEGLERLTMELRDVVLGIRMMPVGDTFATFRRLCRDLSRDLGKEVDLVIEGADTEIDKTMLEQIKDPLVHLVRNCLDHGFEQPDERERAGKPRHGTLRLAAEQEGDRVCITVGDDGRGLDPEKIRAKAVERGLISPEARPTEKEIHQMIFLAGFSTADRVSEVSGRGVGMDVVKRAIEALRGTIDIDSAPGRGTSVKLSVPLTLAIIEGLMIGVDGDRYILPLSSVLETITFDPRSRERNNGRNLVELRRELIPYVDLREVFSSHTDRPREQRAVIVECDGARVGFVVDVVFGNYQTVIKPLGWAARQAGVFSGSTILGDGHVALICDVPAIVGRATAGRVNARGLER